MKILFLNDYHVPQVYRGTEVNTHSLCRILMAHGHNVSVLCGLKAKGHLSLWSRVKMKTPPKSAWAVDRTAGYDTYRTWYVPNVLAEIIDRVSPDIVVLQTTDDGIFSAIENVKVPVLHYFHIIPNQEKIPKLFNPLYVSNSIFCQKMIKYRYGVDSKVIRPIVEFENYKTDVNYNEVTSFGMVHDKGIDLVIKIALLLPRIPFRIFANHYSSSKESGGYMREALKLPNIKVSKPIKSGGNVYKKSKVILMPSRWEETWGRVITEAQVNGIPAITSDRGGLPEAVGEGGICLSIDTAAEEWASQLLNVFNNEKTYSKLQEGAYNQINNPVLQKDQIYRDFIASVRFHLK